jgi:hypothetical protein
MWRAVARLPTPLIAMWKPPYPHHSVLVVPLLCMLPHGPPTSANPLRGSVSHRLGAPRPPPGNASACLTLGTVSGLPAG